MFYLFYKCLSVNTYLQFFTRLIIQHNLYFFFKSVYNLFLFFVSTEVHNCQNGKFETMWLANLFRMRQCAYLCHRISC